MAPSGQLKGSMFLSTFDFIDERFGPGARDRVVARLPARDRDLFQQIVLPISWYPLPAFGHLLREMDRELGSGDLRLVTERGEWTAVRDIRTFRRIVLKLVTISWVIDKGTRLWPQFHDTGSWTVRTVSSREAVAELVDLGTVDDAICASLKGWIIGLSKLTGESTVAVDHVACRAHGAPSCVFNVRWREGAIG